jgi:ABC-type transporter Mla subunit MlaD
MRRSGRDPGLAGNPILIGALTVLVTIVAVTLAYNATNGLPFVPRYNLHVQIANASELTHGADVRMGGSLVGVVDTVTPARTPTGQPVADMNLKLYESINPLPVNSTFTVRLKGAIGLKYLQITPGTTRKGWHNGATVPLGHAGTEVDFDRVLSMFTPPTRTGVQRSTIGFAEALAGRGSDINSAITAFKPLVNDLGPVAQNLSSSHTDLAGFFHGLEQYSAALVPVAETQASLFGNLDTTFRALAGVAVPFLQDTISATPPFFETTIAESPTIQTFLKDTTTLLHDFRPGTATLVHSAPVLVDAFSAGIRNLPGTAALDRRTVTLSKNVAAFGENPSVQAGLDRVTLTASTLRSPIAFLTPVQSSCNYVTLFLRNIQNLLSEHVKQGGLLRFVQIAIQDVPGVESQPSSKPYTGPEAHTAQCTSTHTRTRTRPASRRSARRATSPSATRMP